MSDQFTSVSEQGLGSNLMESIKGVAVGALLFFFSFGVLWCNEGRVDLSEVAKKSVAVSSASVDASASGKFVSVTGELKTDEKIGDPEFLNPGNYLRLDRQVQMFAWVEKKESRTEKKAGGKKVTTTTITYLKDWTSNPKPPREFEEPKGHENLELTLKGEHFAAQKANIGAYSLNPTEASLPSGETLKLTDDIVKGATPEPAAVEEKPADAAGADAAAPADAAKADDGAKADDAAAAADDDSKAAKKAKKKRHGRAKKKLVTTATRANTAAAERKADAIARRKPANFVRVSDTYLFKGEGTIASPAIGDVRVSFTALKPGMQVTLFGLLEGSEVKAYFSKKDDVSLFRALPGARDEAISSLASEHKTIGWLLRLLGFGMMWFGLMMFFGPINALLDIIPFLGSAGRFLIGIAMFPIALILSSVTILISIIAHSPILLVLFLAALIGGGYFLYQKKKKGA